MYVAKFVPIRSECERTCMSVRQIQVTRKYVYCYCFEKMFFQIPDDWTALLNKQIRIVRIIAKKLLIKTPR